MLSQFSGARVLDTGDYEIDGNRYPWVELMQRADELPAGAPGSAAVCSPLQPEPRFRG